MHWDNRQPDSEEEIWHANPLVVRFDGNAKSGFLFTTNTICRKSSMFGTHYSQSAQAAAARAGLRGRPLSTHNSPSILVFS